MWSNLLNKISNCLTKAPKPKAPEPVVVVEKPKELKVSIISQKCVDLVKEFEGLSLKPYLCSAGVPTIGYGTTYYPDNRKVTMKDPEITKEQAESFLMTHLEKYAQTVSKMIKAPYTQGQIDALSCFAYNIGTGNFASSTLLRLFNEGKTKEAAEQFLRWNKAGGRELAGLTRRRQAEKDLFEGK